MRHVLCNKKVITDTQQEKLSLQYRVTITTTAAIRKN